MASKGARLRIVGAVPPPPPSPSPSPAVKRSIKEVEQRVEAVRESYTARGRRARSAS